MLTSPGIQRSKYETAIERVRLNLLLAQGSTTEAAELAAKLPIVDADLGPQIANGLTDRTLLARLALATGHAQQARDLAQQGLSIIEASHSRDYLVVAEQRFRLIAGKALWVSKQATDAEPMLRQATELGEKIYDPARSPELADAQIALAEALLDLKRPLDARVLVAKAKAIHATHKELGEQYRLPLLALEARLAARLSL